MALVPFQRMRPQFVPPERLHRARIAELNLQLDRLHYREQYVVAALLADEWEEARARRRRRTCWVKPWLQRRVLLGQYDTLMHELMRESHGDFKNYMRTDLDMFREMLARVAPRITKSIESRPPIRALEVDDGLSNHDADKMFPQREYRYHFLRSVTLP
ncbi:hypothetical protein HOLleu_06160 [Holothuria leucospilota]|uniref:Uncharacterized protein n=1 Tax=Holothuria leucospilota TaxID=206669 RepID=A0A9Q1CLP9_HOLLE|nr:hypothetical protein HOLleu_06160 [Holothuria leucospilota]